jgi:hypothetical protein
MADFVLDENCYIRALYAQRTDQHVDWLASRLLQLLQTQHRLLITLDNRLAAALIREDIPIRYGFSVLDVSAAWQLLRPQPGL